MVANSGWAFTLQAIHYVWYILFADGQTIMIYDIQQIQVGMFIGAIEIGS
jgi:hypothetical protein